MIELLHVSSKGQIVIPEHVRNKFHIKAGSRLVLIEKGNSLVLRKESDIAASIEEDERRDDEGWMILAQEAFKEVWDNPKDEKMWRKYL